MKISIIILTKNNGNTIGKVLRQISCQQIEDDYEIIIIDSGSSDDTIDQISQYDARFYGISPHEFGHGRTRNMASEYAEGDYLVYLSADAIPASEYWLKNLVAQLADGEIAATFGRQIPYKETLPMERFFIQKNYPSSMNKYSSKDFELSAFFSNVNSAIRYDVWNKIRFAEKLIISEDYDWAKRVYDEGYRINYVPEAAVFHSHNYGLKQVFKRYFDSGTSFSQMGQKPHVIQKGIRYFVDEMGYVMQESLFMIPYAICYDLFKFMGFISGMNQKLLPACIKVHLSMHASYWK